MGLTQENQVDSGWLRAICREASIGLENVGLTVVRDSRVRSVVSIGTKVISRRVTRSVAGGLTTDNASTGV